MTDNEKRLIEILQKLIDLYVEDCDMDLAVAEAEGLIKKLRSNDPQTLHP